MTAAEAYELTAQGGATDFAWLIKACESLRVKVASLSDVTQGKLWAYSDPRRRLSKGKKDELDLIRLAEAHAALKSLYRGELREQIDRG